MNYGINYTGSKGAIADWVLSYLPPASCLVDLFAGGCAITHAAVLSGRYPRVLANDATDSVLLFKEAAEGSVPPPDRWVSRDEFFMFKDSDPYVRLLWSFGGNQKSYIYGEGKEESKRLLHRLLTAPSAEERRLAWRALAARIAEDGSTPDGICEHLERLERLSRIKGLAGFDARVGDYRDCPLPDGCVVYADPPYGGTDAGYNKGFDNEAFCEWARECRHPLVISEYSMPDDFVCIAQRQAPMRLNADSNRTATERLFRHKSQVGEGSGSQTCLLF